MSRARVVFFGNEQLATGLADGQPQLLPALLAHNYEVSALILPPAKSSRQQLPIEAVAYRHQVQVLKSTAADLLTTIEHLKPSVGVLAAYGRLVPAEVIAAIPHGIINLHPSLLPQLRGATPIEQALLEGRTQTGVSLMQLTAQLDAGPIYAQVPLSISPHETKAELAQQLLKLGSELLIDKLPEILSDRLTPTPQNESAATYSQRINKSDGIVNWQQLAVTLERQIRAYAGWPTSQLIIQSNTLIITEARLRTEQSSHQPGLYRDHDRLILVCNPGELTLTRLKPAGSREMAAAAWLNAHHDIAVY